MSKEKVLLSVEEGIQEIMDIIGEAPSIQSPVVPAETVYDGRGHIISKEGKKVHKGYKKGVKRVTNKKDSLRGKLLDAAEVVLSRVVAFDGKVGRNRVEGVVIRLADADYTVKCTGHARAEYADREDGFKASKSYASRGNAVNHSAAIAKALVAEFETQKSDCSFGNQKLITLLDIKSSGIRFDFNGEEYSLKITKKRSRVVFE